MIPGVASFDGMRLYYTPTMRPENMNVYALAQIGGHQLDRITHSRDPDRLSLLAGASRVV